MATLTPIVQKSFDLALLLQNSVGPARWAGISDLQKAELMDVFTQFTVASYVANFDSANGEKFVIAPETRISGKDTVVQSRIVGSSGETTKLDYVMRETSGAWKVVDVLLAQFDQSRGREYRGAGQQEIAHRAHGIQVAAAIDRIG